MPDAADPMALDHQALLAEIERLRPMAELGRLAATVAHEIRNPLAGISANAELLRDVLADPADVESVDIILGEVARLSGLVEDLLHYSRERQARSEPLDLVQVARGVVELLRQQAEQEDVHLFWSGGGLARGDAELARQCLLNIVRNALQACRTGGSVHLLVKPAAIEVCDEGNGVPEALRDSLFEPFVTGRTRGLGLGAAVARRCMQRQGGEVTLLRTGASGSVFLLRWGADP
jgi:signal transduction histidine kinase